MVLAYWATRSVLPSVQEIHHRVYSAQEQGTRTSDLTRFLVEQGFQVFDFSGQWHDLTDQVNKGRPVIVCLGPGGGSQRHYVVVAGIAETHALVNDPADRKLRRIGREDFQKSWDRAGNWMLLAVPRS
jgi:uncharacterized protein YvpB